jgi:hypothetical protein
VNRPEPTQRGFFSSLFDFSFKSYVTPKIIKIIFGVVIAASAIIALFVVAAAFQANAAAGLIVLLIGAPLIFFFYVILYRVFLEVVMAVFTIAENTTRMAQGMPATPAGPGPSPSPYGTTGSWAQPGPYPAPGGPYPPPGTWSGPPAGS